MSPAPDPGLPPGGEPPSLWQTIASVAASFFGVQSSKNRERDFTKGKPLHFIAVGLGMTLAFIGVVWIAVRLALRSAGL
ncbi:DUF2970 domain-containing protein [Solimonas sp. SE-A11]|uniref:DUF2970 domain-containing protein n=1 Tax=Solimonas sp. SE-A11 TaxID=3054954 RepID=UPI00259C9184|nr:DUF2970 domain-containing protein [Solimonas sp. SE-A11]MDM4770110.1 DUF2970 domain-containing protein [Solimonas sp. SE-A11]